MNILLVQPPGANWVPGKRDVSAIVSRTAPLGLLCLASYLEVRGHDVLVRDYHGSSGKDALAHLISSVEDFSPSLLGFTATTSAVDDVGMLSAAVKKRWPDICTILGGVHATAVGAKVLDEFPGLDLLAIGEGEKTLGDLADGAPWPTVRGLVYRDGGSSVSTGMPGQIGDLDDLPMPDYSVLEGFPEAYPLPLFGAPGSRGATIVTSRGCPYRCSFCVRSVFGGSYRTHSAEYVYEQIARLKSKYRLDHVNIADDLFAHDSKRVERLCELLIRKPLEVTFNCSVRAGRLHPTTYQALKKAGCWMISLGIETGDPVLLQRHKPGVSLEKIRGTVKEIKSAGIKCKGLFIAGLPGETPATLQATEDLIRSLDLDDMNLTRFTPFPGSPAWDSLQGEQFVTHDRRLFNCNNTVYLPAGFESETQFESMYRAIIRNFYGNSRWRKRFLARVWDCRGSVFRLVRNFPALLEARKAYNAP